MSFGEFDYVYDSASRLTEVWSNGIRVVENKYDALGRRVIKRTPEAMHIFVYDGWLLVVERIERSGGQLDQIDYWWGKDVSGTLYGAGGIGGLLYLRKNGEDVYVPLYDGNGNVVQYVDKYGTLVAEYAYDAFGNIIRKSGVKADELKMRFSTKYSDDEAGLYYFGRRFYSPRIARWLRRDPIEERGGLNLYAFCGNNSVMNFDKDGCAYFIKRRLDNVPWIDYFAQNAERDVANREAVHEQLIFEDGKTPSDVGYFSDSTTKTDSVWKRRKWVSVPGRYNDCVMRKAVEMVNPLPYSLLGDKKKGIRQYNCQDYADALRSKYNELIKDKKIRCECGLSAKEQRTRQ